VREQAVTGGTSGTSTASYQDESCPDVIDTHRMASEREQRLVLDAQAPRRVEQAPQQERPARPRPVQQPCQRIHR